MSDTWKIKQEASDRWLATYRNKRNSDGSVQVDQGYIRLSAIEGIFVVRRDDRFFVEGRTRGGEKVKFVKNFDTEMDAKNWWCNDILKPPPLFNTGPK